MTENFIITTEPLYLEKYAMAWEDQERLNEIYFQIQRRDRTVEAELLQLQEKYPTVPRIGNHLITLYNRLGHRRRAEKLIESQYRAFPDYLFAKVQYVQLCFAQGNGEAFEEVFEGKRHLKELYPERDVFHISECTAFASVVCQYAAEKGEFDIIYYYRNLIHSIEPHNPAVEFLDELMDVQIFFCVL